MSTVIANDHGSISALGSGTALPFPARKPSVDDFLQIYVPTFDIQITAPLVDFHWSYEIGKVTAKGAIGQKVIITMELLGRVFESDGQFHIEEVWLDVGTLNDRPVSEFIASTILASFGLSEHVQFRIPVIELNLNQRFDVSLKRLSQRLQMRQTAYRLMVIEHATGLEFQIPSSYSSNDIRTISYIFHAITDRSFVWPIETVVVQVPATEEQLEQLPLASEPSRQVIGPMPVVKNLFGYSISLGNEEVILENSIIENVESIRREFAANDGHKVGVIFRSLTGQGRLNLPEAPRLLGSPWDSNIQELIDLESRLDDRLAALYNDLAASTLAGLTEEEIALVTSRPELDEEAFDIEESDGDDE